MLLRCSSTHVSVVKVCTMQVGFRFSTQVSRTHGARPKIILPRKKAWSKGAVLQALSEVTTLDPLTHVQQVMHTPDFSPVSDYNKISTSLAIDKGRQAFERLQAMVPEYFELDWIESQTQINQTNHKSPHEASETQTDDAIVGEGSLELLEEFISSGDVQGACQAYKRLLDQKVDIPTQLKNKALGFIALSACEHKYNTKMGDKNLYYLSFEILRADLEHTKTPDQEVYSLSLRTYAKLSRAKDALQCYSQMRREGFVPDAKTLTLLLLSLENASPASATKVVEDVTMGIKSGRMEPTLEIFMGCLLCTRLPHKASSRQILEFFGKFVKDMEFHGLQPNADIYLMMLKIASMRLWNLDIVNTILTVLEKENLELISDHTNVTYFTDAMFFAYETENLSLAKRVWKLATAERFSRLLLSNGQQSPDIYWLYLNSVCKMDSIENIAETLVRFVPVRVSQIEDVLDNVLASAVKSECPQILPYVFSEINRSRDEGMAWVKSWISTAILLHPKADEDTITQFNNIALLMLNSVKNSRIRDRKGYLDLLCLLVAKSRDKTAIRKFLSEFKKLFPTLELSDVALGECEEMLQPLSDLKNNSALQNAESLPK